MQQAREAVLRGDADGALTRFRAARTSFATAAAQTRSGALRIVAAAPALGRNVDAVGDLSRAGARTAQAGIEIADAMRALPRGIEALAPARGRIPLRRLPTLAVALARAQGLVTAALDEVRSSATSGLLPPVLDARTRTQSSLEELDAALGSAADTLAVLPEFLGADGSRTYLFGAANPAELRGTGGLIGAYALLRADDGRLSFSAFRPVESLPLLDPNDVRAPNADYHRLYDGQRTGNGFWLNANMTPDFPSAARALETGLEAATPRSVDGVVVADPFALRALLRTTGPAAVPGFGVRVSAGTVVALLANQAYARFDDPSRRKLVLGDVAEAVLGRFLHVAHATGSVRALADAAGDGHVMMYSDDRVVESALAETVAGGALHPGAGADLLSVVVNNGAANKVDYYVDRDVRYDVTLHDDGTASARTAVRLANHAPTRGLPSYVIGPSHGATDRPGQDVSILGVYCGRCRVTSAVRDGDRFDPVLDHELGSGFAQAYVTVDAGDTTTTAFRYALTRTWSGRASGGTYTLRFLNQPTIRPTSVAIAVRVPPGMHIVHASAGVSVDGSVARWSGTPGRTLEVDVSFAPSMPERVWHSLFG